MRSTLAILPLLFACSASPAAHSGHDRRVDFTTYGSFALQEHEVEGAYDKPGYTREEEHDLARAMGDVLAGQGYREEPVDTADLLVSVTVDARVRPRVVTPEQQVGLENTTGGLYVVTEVEGSVVIRIFDRRNGDRVWHGWAQTDLFEGGSYDAAKGEGLVHAIMALYPPEPDPRWVGSRTSD